MSPSVRVAEAGLEPRDPGSSPRCWHRFSEQVTFAWPSEGEL